MCYEYVLHNLNDPDLAMEVLHHTLSLAAADVESALSLLGRPFIQEHSDAQWRALVDHGLMQLLLDLLLGEDIFHFYASDDGTRPAAPDILRIVSMFSCLQISMTESRAHFWS